MKYLLDTNQLIDFLKNKKDIVSKLKPLFENGLAISVITGAEFLQGAYKLKDPKPVLELLNNFLEEANIDILEIDWSVVEKYAFLQAQFDQKGQRAPSFDLLIASTALVHNLILISEDKVFQRISKLKVI